MLRNKVTYLILMGYSIVFAILYNEYVSALIAISVIFLPLILLVMIMVTVPYITLEVLPFTENVSKGDFLEVCFKLRNTSYLPITYCKIYFAYGNMYLNSAATEKVNIFADSRSEVIVKCRITAGHCGVVNVQCKAIRIYDYFKIFSIKKPVKVIVKIPVLPELYEIESEFDISYDAMNTDSNVFSKIKKGDDPSEVFDIREYKEGDKIQRIHWKLSSKKEQYMIKDYSLPINCSVGILVDLFFAGNADDIFIYMDALLETVFSLAYFLFLGECKFYLMWYDCKREELERVEVEEEEQLYLALHELMNACVYDDKEIFLRTHEVVYGLDRMSEIFYISGCVFSDSMEYLNCIAGNLHIIFVGKQEDISDSFSDKLSLIEITNVQESLKGVIF